MKYWKTIRRSNYGKDTTKIIAREKWEVKSTYGIHIRPCTQEIRPRIYRDHIGGPAKRHRDLEYPNTRNADRDSNRAYIQE